MEKHERPLDQLNQRELLILLNEKVGTLEEKMDSKNESDMKIMLDINTLKVTLRERSAMWGMVGSLVMTGLIQLVIFYLSK
jgi:hypothetical protein